MLALTTFPARLQIHFLYAKRHYDQPPPVSIITQEAKREPSSILERKKENSQVAIYS
jgi:hypothetical protein